MLNWSETWCNHKNATAVRVRPGHKTAGLCQVWVVHLPRRSGLGFWQGNVPNRNELPAKNRNAGRLPGPVANTTADRISTHLCWHVCFWSQGSANIVYWTISSPTKACNPPADCGLQSANICASIIDCPPHSMHRLMAKGNAKIRQWNSTAEAFATTNSIMESRSYCWRNSRITTPYTLQQG
jgi:hypothetical protein